MGITYDANGIYVDNLAGVTFDSIRAAVTGAEMLRVDSGSGHPTYRVLKTIFPGYSGAGVQTTNPLSIVDGNCVLTFDAGKFINTRTTNLGNLTWTLGTKIGSGDEAGAADGVDFFFKNAGPNIRGIYKLYGCRFKQAPATTGQIVFIPSATADGSEFIGCQFEGFSNFVCGASGAYHGNTFDSRIVSGNQTTQLVTAHFKSNSKRVSLVSRGLAGRYLVQATSNLFFKDYLFLGTVLTTVVNSSSGQNWLMYRPTWPQGITRFAGGAGNPIAQEFWGLGVKLFWPSGLPAAGVPVKLTDFFNLVQVDTVTNANGEISFGSGAGLNMARVVDHIGTPSYYIRHRSPMTLEINKGVGRVDGYKSITEVFRWAGYEGFTFSSGQFQDMYLAYQLVEGNDPPPPTNWEELEVPV